MTTTGEPTLVESSLENASQNIVEHNFANGLKLLTVENHAAPVVTVLVLFKVGSRNEAVGFTGATHFLEHMLFKGTKKYNADKGNGIDDLLTQVGAYWNATTWFDRTSYFEVVPSEYLDLCLKLEADRMRNLLLRQEDHDSEMSVVRNEFERGENYPEEALEKELYAIAFREHPYHHPTIGWRSDVEGVSMVKLREFYDTFYWPDNTTLVLVGDFQTDHALKLVDKYFGKISGAPRPIPGVYTLEPPQEGERRFEIKRAGDLARVWVGYHVPPADHEDNYALALLRHILGGTHERSSRLYKSLVDTGIASDAFARHHDLKDPGLFILGAMVNSIDDLQKAETILHEELTELSKEPPSTEELLRAKVANRKGTILSKADASSLAFLLGEAESKADWRWLINYDDNFDAVTQEDVMRVVRRYFVKSNRTVGYFIPEHQNLVDLSNVEESGRSESNAPQARHQQPPSTLNEIKQASPAVPKVKVSRPKAPVTKYEQNVQKHVLSNGMKLLLMAVPGTESLGISGIIRAGKYFSLANENVADLAVDLLPKGSEGYSKLEIAELLDMMALPSALDFSIDAFRVSFGTQLVASDLPQFAVLLSDVIRRPAFDATELTKTTVEWKAKYAEAMNSPRMRALNLLRQEIYPAGHPFYETSFEEQLAQLDQVKLADIRSLHATYFKPDATVVSIVGDIDLKETVDLFKKTFGDWEPGKVPHIQVPEVSSSIKPKRLNIDLPDKRSTDIVIGHPCLLKRKERDFYAARIANAALGQDTITSRLGQIVRDRAGLTYGIYSSFSDTAFGYAPWMVSLSVNPRNVDKALHLVSEVLKDYIDGGISQEELDKETGRAIGSFKVGLASSLGIAKVLCEFEFLGLGVKELDQITRRYKSVTKQQVDEALRKYLHPDQALTIVAGTL